MKGPFVQELWKFISCYGFSKVIMLTSSDAARRTDEQINGYPTLPFSPCLTRAHFILMLSPQFQVVHVYNPDGQSDLSEKLAKLTLSTPTSLTQVPVAPTQISTGTAKRKHFPSSGHLRHFLRMAEQDKYSKREVVALVMFAAEGDNSEDAKAMASVISKSINVEISEWKAPRSWEGLFGEAVRAGAEEGLFW
jgi:hypothetical protein